MLTVAFLVVYGTLYEGIGIACFDQRLPLLGVALSVWGGCACILSAQIMPAHIFVSIQSLGIPTAIFSSQALSPPPRRTVWPYLGAAIIMISVIMLALHARDVRPIHEPPSEQFWAALITIVLLAIANALGPRLWHLALLGAACGGALMLGVVELGFSKWWHYPLAALCACADLFLNATSVIINTPRIHTPVEYALWNLISTFAVGPFVRHEFPVLSLVVIMSFIGIICGVFIVVQSRS